MPDRQSPIFTKTYDLILWLLNHTDNFPKNERFRLAKRLEDGAFHFYDLLVEAVRSRQVRAVLLSADLQLEKLRLLLRVCHARKLTATDQYHYASGLLVEIGKLLGGWLETVEVKT